MEYVLGFMFNEARSHVLLIQKKRPDWQNGKFNGVGGKIEVDELPIEAMVREFHEETGIRTHMLQWEQFCKLVSNENEDKFIVTIYRGFSDSIYKARSMTDEQVFVTQLDLNFFRQIGTPELAWQVAMALSVPITFEGFYAEVYYQKAISKRNA